MNFAQLQLECKSVLRDPTTESSIPVWLNDSMDEIAAQFEIPALRLHKPATLATTDTEWVYDIATTVTPPVGHPEWVFHKKAFRIASAHTPLGFVMETPFTVLDDVDFAHTTTGTNVERIAVEDDTIGVYPLANDTLQVWFYRRPVHMVADDDVPDGMPTDYAYKVLIPKVVLRAMRDYPEIQEYGERGDNTRTLARWTQLLHQGLYGSGYEIGLVDYLRKQRGVFVRGPALGSNVSAGGFYTRRRVW